MNPKRQTLLVVEDEIIIRMCAVAALEEAGFTVLEAANSAEALAIMAHHDEISILLTDVTMPGPMDGLDLVAQALRDYPSLRAIVTSAKSSAEAAGKVGAQSFIPKPYPTHAIVKAVRDTISCS